jgi:hypothetical protein
MRRIMFVIIRNLRVIATQVRRVRRRGERIEVGGEFGEVVNILMYINYEH